MLDSYFKIAHRQQVVEEKRAQLLNELSKFPVEELRKLASGEVKVGYLGDTNLEWLNQFKGTPLFEQAVQLEQESIQLEVAEKQQRDMSQSMFDSRDQLCLKKRLLSLQLAQMEQRAMTGQNPGAPAPGQPASPEAASPSPSAQPGASASPETPGAEGGGMSPKSISVKLGTAAEWGRELAQREIGREKAAQMGALLAKEALDLGGVVNTVKSQAKPMAQKAMQVAGNFARQHPAAAFGALSGAASGALSSPGDRVGGTLKGGLVGGAIGFGAQKGLDHLQSLPHP